jgi:indole-3-glycerol phosphate synthase
MNVLRKIFEGKRLEVERSKASVPLSELRDRAAAADPPRDFLKALEGAPELALIAEVKKASPSQGLIRPNFDPVEVATSYRRAGAHALSVLTDVDHFQGALENLPKARRASGLPCLRKDFLFDPYQVYEARALGADAVLLIAAMLDSGAIRDLRGLALELGMASLVEVHTEEEAESVLALGCDLVGVNNRNLADFKTSIELGERILPMVARHAFAVSESALETRRDLDRVRDAGARAVLIGTTFCASPDIEAKVREVMAW